MDAEALARAAAKAGQQHNLRSGSPEAEDRHRMSREDRALNEKAFEEDPVRTNDFALDGWRQLFVTYRRRQESPQNIVAEVAAALAVRGGV